LQAPHKRPDLLYAHCKFVLSRGNSTVWETQ